MSYAIQKFTEMHGYTHSSYYEPLSDGFLANQNLGTESGLKNAERIL